VSEGPDIVWIYCDELRADALGCYGHPEFEVHTPHLDRLARMGTRFANSFCNSPICVASRICTLTGLHCERTGVYSNEGAWPKFEMPRQLDTFPQALARAGYQTANFGKIHVNRAMQSAENPAERCFQVNEPAGGGMGFWTHLGDEGVQMIRPPRGGMNGGVYPADEPYPPDAVVRNALAWMQTAESPAFTRISILQPHTPVLPPAAYADLYVDAVPADKLPAIPPGLSLYEKLAGEAFMLDQMDPEQYRLCVAHYYAQVAWIDDQVGLVLADLEKRGRLENTIIVFSADHGNPLGETGGFEKHGFMATVHRVPHLMAWPGTLPADRVDDAITDSLDLGPTLFDLCGVDCPAQFGGRSVVSEPAREAVFSTISHGRPFSKRGPNGGSGVWTGNRGWPRRTCVRTDRWRFERNVLLDGEPPTTTEDVDAFLVDWRADPLEFTNVVAQPEHADVVEHLSQLIDDHIVGSVEVPDRCLQK
jgi:choline-sulfatase